MMMFASISITSVYAAAIHFQWDRSKGIVDGYRIYYGTVSGAHPERIDVGNVTSYEVNTLQPNSAYYFVVRAYNSVGESKDSNEVSWPEISVKIVPGEIKDPKTDVSFKVKIDPVPSQVVKFKWDFKDGTGIKQTNSFEILHAFDKGKEYPVDLSVIFPNGSILKKQLTVRVHDEKPKAPPKPALSLK